MPRFAANSPWLSKLCRTALPQKTCGASYYGPARTAFGRWPEAWWITIPATDFAFGAPLSPLTERGIADALATVRLLLAPSSPATDAARDPRPEFTTTEATAFPDRDAS